jgi:hypothetical protein
VQLFDAAGLCLFAVTGTEKALAFGLNPFVAAVLGMVIGGGVAREPSSTPWWPSPSGPASLPLPAVDVALAAGGCLQSVS